jgi:hypothetical protein
LVATTKLTWAREPALLWNQFHQQSGKRIFVRIFFLFGKWDTKRAKPQDSINVGYATCLADTFSLSFRCLV